MKRLSRILPTLALALLVAMPVYAQNTGSLVGKVLGRDGQPAANVQLQVDSLMLNNGRLQIRERLTAKTGRNGEFSLSGLYIGRVMVTVLENGQPVLSHGDKVGDEMFVANGIDLRVPTLDLSKAPPPVAAAPTANTSGMSDEEKKALKEKLEKEAAAAGEATKAFDAGKAAYAARNYPEAITQFKIAAERQPSQDVIWANLGRVYHDAKEYDNSIASYEKAITLKPTEANYFVNLSLAQIGAGKLDESRKTVEKAVALNPASAVQAYNNIGITLMNMGKLTEAAEPFKKAIELDPKFANGYYQLGMISVNKGNFAEGLKNLEEYVKVVPPPAADDKTMGPCSNTVATCVQMAKDMLPILKAEAAKAAAPAAAPAGSRGGRN
jgi:tetratricopeptide (TPR) repeat protein